MKALLLTLILASFAMSFPVRADTALKVDGAYAFAATAGARSAAAFLTISYPPSTDGSVPDRLMSVETPVAGRSEIHTVLIEDDVMMMRRVEAFPLPPMGNISFSPQGPHIMMMELRQALTVGDSFPLILRFEKAGPVEVAVQVRAVSDMPAAAVAETIGAEPAEEKAVHEDMPAMPGHHH